MQRRVFKSEEGRRAIQTFYAEILAAAPVPLRTRFVPTSRGRTHLVEAGPEDGQALLLLHGSASNSAAWLADVSLWSRTFRVVAADLPVFGDAELRRLQMPVQYFGGADDVLLRAKDSARRITRLLPHAQVHLLAERGHAMLGQTETILAFLNLSRDH